MEGKNFTKILVTGGSIKAGDISSDIMDQLTTSASYFVRDGSLDITPWQEYPYSRYIQQLVTVRDLLRNHKIQFTPQIFAILYTDLGETFEVSIKTKAKEVKITTGSMKTLFTNASENNKKKTLTVEEKIKLVISGNVIPEN